MADLREDRERCRALAEQLIAEYAGAVPPGQVLATVVRANHTPTRHLKLSIAARMALCESSARRSLTDRTAGDLSDGAPSGAARRVGNGALAS